MRAAASAANGVPGVVAEVDGEITVVRLILDGARIREIAVVPNPEKVGRVTRLRTGRVRRLDSCGRRATDGAVLQRLSRHRKGSGCVGRATRPRPPRPPG